MLILKFLYCSILDSWSCIRFHLQRDYMEVALCLQILQPATSSALGAGFSQLGVDLRKREKLNIEIHRLDLLIDTK